MKRLRCLLVACTGLMALLILVSGLSAQQMNTAKPSLSHPVLPDSSYTLNPGDIMHVSVWGEQNLNGQYSIDPKGAVTFPLVGEIQAAGLTQAQFLEALKAGLRKYLVDPKVDLQLMQFRRAQVFVLGQLNRPGEFEFDPGQKIADAVAMAGSYSDNADIDNATLTRKGSDTPIPVHLDKILKGTDLSGNVELKNGDLIVVPEDVLGRYFVLGEVLRPGVYKFKKEMTLLDALSNAQGTTPSANKDNVYIVRGNPQSPQKIHVDYYHLIKKGDLTQNLKLEPGDTIYVGQSKKPDWNAISNVVSTFTNATWLVRTVW